MSVPFVRVRRRAGISTAALITALLPCSIHAQAAGISAAKLPAVAPIRALQHTRVVLPNGLVAIFNEDHSSPIVAIRIAYDLGAKDEKPGATGLAHLCEHMMFEGSQNLAPGEFMAKVRAAGGISTRWGETSEDRTMFYETVPSTQLEMTLWLEAERMAAPFRATDSTRLAAARGAIKNERQELENSPFSSSNPVTAEVLYGSVHPYRSPIGPMDDLNGASFSAMRDFCTPYYVPNNAVLVVSGDFKTAEARTMVQKYFGGIPRGTPAVHPEMRPAIAGERRVVLEDPRGRAPTLRVAWAGVGFNHPDKAALRALASLLTGGQTSGLAKALVYDRQLATFVVAVHIDNENGGFFQIEVSPRGATPLGVIENVVDSLVSTARDTKPTPAQLERWKRADADTAITALQSRLARADTLAQGQAWAADPVAYAKQQAAAVRLTPADIQRAAQKYLTGNRVVMSMVPTGKLDLISKPEKPWESASKILPGEVK